MVVIGIVAAEAPTERSNTFVFAASDVAALHRLGFVAAPPMFVAVTRGAAAHIVVDPASSAKSNSTS